MGRPVAMWDRDELSAIDFGPGDSSVGGFSPMPWRRQWAGRGFHATKAVWIHVDRAKGHCQVFAENNLPRRYGGGWSFPGTWIVEERGDQAILAANAASRNGPAGRATRAGVHFYRIGDRGLDLMNVTPIPYLAWASWLENETVMLAGMTQRESLPARPGEEKTHALARPALIRCFLDGDRWEEVRFLERSGERVDLLRDFPDRFEMPHRYMSKATKTEAWVASERMVGGERVLVAAMGIEGAPGLDNLDTRAAAPFKEDHVTLAFVSYPTGKMLVVEQGCHFERSLYTPDRTMFVVCRQLRHDWETLRYYQTVQQLHLIDPLRSGLAFHQMTFDALDPSQPYHRFDAAFYPQVGFLGTVEHEDVCWLFRSEDGLAWKFLGDSRSLPLKSASASTGD